MMGQLLEQPVSDLLSLDFKKFQTKIYNSDRIELIYCWLAMILFKNAYKDKFTYRKVENPGGDRIWEHYHHLNSSCRLFYPEISLTPASLGTLYFFNVENSIKGMEFLYKTFPDQHTILIKINNIAIIAAMDDCGISKNIFDNNYRLKNQDEALNLGELLEIFSHITLINEFLEFRPEFITWTSIDHSRAELRARIPKIFKTIYDARNLNHNDTRQQIFHHVFVDYPLSSEQRQELYEGTRTMLSPAKWLTIP